jgi:hypothetical protein
LSIADTDDRAGDGRVLQRPGDRYPAGTCLVALADRAPRSE